MISHLNRKNDPSKHESAPVDQVPHMKHRITIIISSKGYGNVERKQESPRKRHDPCDIGTDDGVRGHSGCLIVAKECPCDKEEQYHFTTDESKRRCH